MIAYHRPLFYSLFTLAVIVMGNPLAAQDAELREDADELEFYYDDYFQDESFERRFLGTSEPLDEIDEDIEPDLDPDVDLEADPDTEANAEVEVDPNAGVPPQLRRYDDPDDLEVFEQEDRAASAETRADYLDRSDKSPDIVPEAYGDEFEAENNRVSPNLRRYEDTWIDRDYPEERFYDNPPRRVIGPDLPEVQVYDDPDDEFWYETRAPTEVEVEHEEDNTFAPSAVEREFYEE